MDTQYTKLKILGYSFVARSKNWEIFAKHIEYGTDTHIENFAITLPNKKEIVRIVNKGDYVIYNYSVNKNTGIVIDGSQYNHKTILLEDNGNIGYYDNVLIGSDYTIKFDNETLSIIGKGNESKISLKGIVKDIKDSTNYRSAQVYRANNDEFYTLGGKIGTYGRNMIFIVDSNAYLLENVIGTLSEHYKKGLSISSYDYDIEAVYDYSYGFLKRDDCDNDSIFESYKNDFNWKTLTPDINVFGYNSSI